jgi:hypothetical protein
MTLKGRLVEAVIDCTIGIVHGHIILVIPGREGAEFHQ